MPKKTKTLKEFITEANIIHQFEYDYSLVVYKNIYTKIDVICNKHGVFKVNPGNHLKGVKCAKCSVEKRNKDKIKKHKERFITRAILVHKNLYTYENTKYTTSRNKVIVTCKKHGDFSIVANSHLLGIGCRLCGFENTRNKIKVTKKHFIKKSRKKHGNKYNYSLVNYKGNDKKVKIICPIHGVFEQRAANHYRYGCIHCGEKTRDLKSNTFSYSGWKKQGEHSKYFDSFKLYLLKCWNKDETFYKVGRTFRKIKERFNCKYFMPYEFIIEDVIQSSAENICLLEHKVKTSYSKYTPKIKFPGYNECIKEKVDLKKELNYLNV